ncbi:MAG: carboxypeptidase regulatory-like domain-containing protein [Holophagaceae bacterium]|jgi:hypothetical protein|uniref:Carboxypeptidase regulatory-like domain-containing protein n=1 Tax=Candidatus Geothrix odensensis TaxID=2954440 RepID=A0A936EZF8_9BACT|nr:carboxypeptidase regulatory-like domain-containing protein [Candidatus Geothrix odensensis]
MLRPTQILLLATTCLVGLPALAQARLTGRVTHQIGGSVGRLPETRPLAGATVLIGTNLHLEVGSGGTDTVKGRVLAKDLTEGNGSYTLSVPAGTYTVICWKQGYVPQVERNVVVAGSLDLDIGKDTAGRGLHQQIAHGK